MKTKHAIFLDRIAECLEAVRRAKHDTVRQAVPGIALPGYKTRVDRALAEHVFNGAVPGLSIPFAEAAALCEALQQRLGHHGGELNLVDAAALYRLAVGMDCAAPIKTTMSVTGRFEDLPLTFSGDFNDFIQELRIVPELEISVPYECNTDLPALPHFGPVTVDAAGNQSCTMSGHIAFFVTLTGDEADGKRPLTGATIKLKAFEPGGQPQYFRLTEAGVDRIEQQ